MFRRILFSCLFVLHFCGGAVRGGSVLQPGDRIIFIGDSITGQGRNAPEGWANLIDHALEVARPSADFESVSLGGSGQGVSTWRNVEQRSRDGEVILDVKETDVRATLDSTAQVVVFMLGMNDVLAPRLKDDPADLKEWENQYRQLIQSIRDRVKPRVLAIATPTLCTEDETSPKNQVMRKLIEKIHHLAATENLLVLPTHQAMADLLKEGRRYQPNFHVTGDSVHPNAAGHLAIAAGMLKGLGEDSAAEKLVQDHRDKLQARSKNPISWSVRHQGQSKAVDEFLIDYFSPDATAGTVSASLTAPDGWTVTPGAQNADSGQFLVTGQPDRLVNKLTLKVDGKVAFVSIPAPWLIGTSPFGSQGWHSASFDPEKGRLPVDEALARGEGLGQESELAPGKPIQWTRYFPTIGYGGDNAPGAIDLAAVTFYQNHAVAYGARWIHAPEKTPARLTIKPTGFGNHDYLQVWFNGTPVFQDHVDTAKERSAGIDLHPGWNLLAFKSNHLQWQWQFSLDLKTTDPRKADELRIRTGGPAE
jgi:lysophospholipase L1-like esterase